MKMSYKTRYLIVTIISYASVILIFKYGLAVILPFVIAYLLAWCIRPVNRVLVDRIHIPNGLSAAISLFLVTGAIGYGTFLILKSLALQFGQFASRWNSYSNEVSSSIKYACRCAEHFTGLKKGIIYYKINTCIDRFNFDSIIDSIVDCSISGAVVVIDLIVMVFLILIASYYLIKDKDKHDYCEKRFVFGLEINRIKGRIYKVGVAYLKTQLILMAITSVICYIGFEIAGIEYALMFAVITGFLDSLPLIGIGVVLIPAVILYALKKAFIKALIILIVFIICYCIREIFEPRIMGKNVGLSPLVTMITLYAGYKVFGLIGVITGPFVYIIANELREIIMESSGDDD